MIIKINCSLISYLNKCQKGGKRDVEKLTTVQATYQLQPEKLII